MGVLRIRMYTSKSYQINNNSSEKLHRSQMKLCPVMHHNLITDKMSEPNSSYDSSVYVVKNVQVIKVLTRWTYLNLVLYLR
mmetsp:Transcript_3711/g.6570  ORF Transcript_3711/g.6570 Transcript_3711/m.6570 type:complete len:81 (+) Transcript_3711:1802-2044(+)